MFKRAIFILISILTLVAVVPLVSYCGWLNKPDIPVPAYTKEQAKGPSFLAGSEFSVAIYNSELSYKDIADFYRKNLVKLGWQEIAVRSLPGSLAFKKDKELIIISNIIASSKLKTTYFLSKGEPYFLNKDARGNIAQPKEPEIKIKDMPVYPGAEIIPFTSIVDVFRQQQIFTTPDAPNKVFNYYREKLIYAGWEIAGEVPLATHKGSKDWLNFPGVEKLPAKIQADLKNAVLTSGSIRCLKDKQTCILSVLKLEKPESKEGNETTLSISCNR